MTIKHSIEAFNKSNESLAFEIEISSAYLEEIRQIMNLNNQDYEDFINGIGGFNMSQEQVKKIEKLLGRSFYEEQYIFQIV